MLVQPGDVIFGDMDGVICIPRDIACAVLLESEEHAAKEQDWRAILRENLTAEEALARGVMF